MSNLDTLENRCWADCGVWGNSSCQKLGSVVHCRNCDAFKDVASKRLPDVDVLEPNFLASEKQQECNSLRAFLVFKCSNKAFAIDPTCVGEITSVSSIHRIPHRVGDAIDGIANINGELVLVVNIYSALRFERTVFKEDAMMVLCKSGGEKFAFKADEIVGVRRIEMSKITTFKNVDSKFISEKFASDELGETLIIDAQLLAGAIVRRLI